MLISEHTLRPADVIVSTTDASVSAVIRAGIGSSVSHSMIYLGGSFVIEAVAEGVVRRSLSVALEQAALAIALRRRSLTDQQRSAVVDYATQFMFRPYDKIGAAGSGTSVGRGSLLAAFGCGITLGLCAIGIAGMADNAKPANADRAFFCSELVARVFELAGAPVVAGAPSYTTPRQIRMADTLLYLGKLVDKSSPAVERDGPAQGAEGAGGF